MKSFQFRIWSRKEALNQTTYALSAGISALEFYENYYNIPFPLKKQGEEVTLFQCLLQLCIIYFQFQITILYE